MSTGAKIVVGSVVAILLGIGLCGTVAGDDSSSWRLAAGSILFLGGLVGLFVGLVTAAIGWLNK
jgi:hypothetical protein